MNAINKQFFLPPLIMESTILYNATNSIGPIFEKSYTPTDGTFHSNNEGFEDSDHMHRNTPYMSSLDIGNGRLTELAYSKGSTKAYEKATVDNLTIGGLCTNAPKNFMGSVGIGIIPLLNQDGTLEDSLLNILVETSIDLECISHGTNLLMSRIDKAQPNTNYVGLSVDKYKWANKYTVTGAPAMETSIAQTTTTAVDIQPTPVAVNVRPAAPPTPQPTPPRVPTTTTTKPVNPKLPPRKRKQEDDNSEQAKKIPKQWYEEGEKTIDENGHPVTFIRADKVPGQKRIYGKMTEEEKLAIAKENNEVRKMAQSDLAHKHIYIRYTGTNRPLGITRTGAYYDTAEDRLAVVTVGSTYDGPMARQLRQQIESGRDNVHEDPEPTYPKEPAKTRKQPEKKPVTEIKVNHRGNHITIVTYNDEQALIDNNYPRTGVTPTLKIEGIPGDLVGNEEYTNNDQSLWDYLNTIAWLKPGDRNKLYGRILEKYDEDRHAL